VPQACAENNRRVARPTLALDANLSFCEDRKVYALTTIAFRAEEVGPKRKQQWAEL
jgi:hypothetical protein